MTLTIKRDGNWSSFQLANSALPLSVTSSAIAPSARMDRKERRRNLLSFRCAQGRSHQRVCQRTWLSDSTGERERINASQQGPQPNTSYRLVRETGWTRRTVAQRQGRRRGEDGRSAAGRRRGEGEEGGERGEETEGEGEEGGRRRGGGGRRGGQQREGRRGRARHREDDGGRPAKGGRQGWGERKVWREQGRGGQEEG